MLSAPVAAEAAGTRLDAFLQGQPLPDGTPLSQKRARDLCTLGMVAVDGVLADSSTRLRAGQTVCSRLDHALLALQLRLPVVHNDDDTLVLHKPAGLAVHKGPLVDHSVADVLAAHLPGAGLAQRLDREASGLLLVGRHPAALRALGAAMEDGRITRDYLVVASGELADDRRTVDLPLLVTDEPRGDRPKTLVDPAGQRAVSHLTVLGRRKGYTLVLVSLATGRTHQIRAHLRAIGHPLLGDPRYGDPATNERARATFGVVRTMLQGHHLRCPGAAGTTVDVTAHHEPEFVRLFPALGRPS